MTLTRVHADILLEVKDGADILNSKEARLLRQIQKTNPKYVNISKPQGSYEVSERLPYLGAIATPKGVEWAKGVS